MLDYKIADGLVGLDKLRLQPLLDLEIPTKKTLLKRILSMFEYYAKWSPHFSDFIQPLIKAKQFPLDTKACETFYNLKQLFMKAALHCPNNSKPYVISDVTVSLP